MDCNPGQGEYKKSFNHTRNISLEECKQKCQGIKACIGVDYTNTDKYKSRSSCRLYKHNIERETPGDDRRQYCKKSSVITL